MATKIHENNDEVEAECLREENNCRTIEARSKIAEIREKNQERSEDDKRERALQSIHRMEWLKNKVDLSILQRKSEMKLSWDLLPLRKKELDDYFSGTAKAKQRDRKKERVEAVRTLEDLFGHAPDPRTSKIPTPPPPPINAWSSMPGSALFPNTTAATMVTLKLKNCDEDAMLETALKESLSPEDQFSGEYEESPFVKPSGIDRSPRHERRIQEQDRIRNGNQSAHGQWSDFEHSAHRQRNNIEYSVNDRKNDIINKPEKNDQNHSSRMKQGFGPLRREVTEREYNTSEKKPCDTSSGGKSDGEKAPIDYYQKGKELAERRARERAIMFAAMEAEKKKKMEMAQESKPTMTNETERDRSMEKKVRFSLDEFGKKSDDSGKEDPKDTSRDVSKPRYSDTRAETLRSSPVERQSPKINNEIADFKSGEQRQMWTSKDTTAKSSEEAPPSYDVPQQDSTESIQPQEQDTSTNQNAAPKPMYPPEDFILMDNAAGTRETNDNDIVSTNQPSLGYETGLNHYTAPQPYNIGNYPMPNNSFLTQYNAAYPAAHAQNLSSCVPTETAAPAQNFKTGLETGYIPQYNPAVKVSSTLSGSTNLTPNYVASNNTASNNIAAMNYYAANNALPQNTPTVADKQSQIYSNVNVQHQIPVSPVSTLQPSNTSVPSSMEGGGREGRGLDLLNIDRRVLQWNCLINQYIMAHLSGIPEACANNVILNLPSFMPPLPNIPPSPPTPLAEVAKSAPPPPVLVPNFGLTNSSHQLPGNEQQSALLMSTNYQPEAYTDSSQMMRPPTPQAGYCQQVQPQPRLPGSFVRGPPSRGRGSVQTLNYSPL